MALSELYDLKPFRRYVFWPLAVLPGILIMSVAVAAYWYMSHQNVIFLRQDLKGIASRTANFIPTEIHERITTSNDRNGEDYDLIHLYLQSVMAGNDNIDDIYTVRVNADQSAFTYVVGGANTQDRNGDHIIDEWEQQRSFGAEFDSMEYPLVFDGLQKPVVDDDIMFRENRNTMTAFAPLQTDKGATVGVLGVDYSADSLAEQRTILFRRVFGVAVLVLILSVVAAWWITRQITKPIIILIRGLDRVRAGEYGYEIPGSGRLAERVIARLFNTNKEIMMAAGVARQQDQLRQGKQESVHDQSQDA